MKVWVISKTSEFSAETSPLTLMDIPVPEPQEGQVLLKINTCGVCHTEIDEIEGRTPPPSYPIVPGHQAVGRIVLHKGKRKDIHTGDRAGVAWIFSACGSCEFCLSGQENLCDDFIATGRDVNGGYAEYMIAQEDFVFRIPDVFSDAEAAPLLCAGAVGYRALSLCNMKDRHRLGLTGFGASGHLVLKLTRHQFPNSEIYVFARDPDEREFALYLGASWAGNSSDKPPDQPDCIIDTTPVWTPAVNSLQWLKPGGRLVINAIRKEDLDKVHLLRLDYPTHLWLEKEIKSVANVTRNDVVEFLRLAAEMGFKPDVQEYPFEDANKALLDIKNRRIKGAKVLRIG
ncbi:MAG: zinc-dependent alcohol dehydrogenase family protein [Bacteroidales bacterium]|nr:zinc-dependent alcohol dehydrogenase family protein [Bacteroidales bacterium]